MPTPNIKGLPRRERRKMMIYGETIRSRRQRRQQRDMRAMVLAPAPSAPDLELEHLERSLSESSEEIAALETRLAKLIQTQKCLEKRIKKRKAVLGK